MRCCAFVRAGLQVLIVHLLTPSRLGVSLASGHEYYYHCTRSSWSHEEMTLVEFDFVCVLLGAVSPFCSPSFPSSTLRIPVKQCDLNLLLSTYVSILVHTVNCLRHGYSTQTYDKSRHKHSVNPSHVLVLSSYVFYTKVCSCHGVFVQFAIHIQQLLI